jgi:hypothetical protein
MGRALLAVGAPRRQRGHPEVASPTGPTLEVFTFVSDDRLYADMRRSFEAAGFDGLVRLSDRGSDPYEFIRALGGGAHYTVLCHQDVRLDRGHGAAELLAALQALDVLDPDWVVAGNAGTTRSGRIVRHLYDHYGGPTTEEPPLPVVTLDENFLVFNGRRQPRVSDGLAGFHFYGTDICLNALADGGGCRILPYLVTHLGGTSRDGDNFEARRREFLEAWYGRSRFGYRLTPQEAVFVSRWAAVRRVFGSQAALWRVDRRRTLSR